MFAHLFCCLRGACFSLLHDVGRVQPHAHSPTHSPTLQPQRVDTFTPATPPYTPLHPRPTQAEEARRKKEEAKRLAAEKEEAERQAEMKRQFERDREKALQEEKRRKEMKRAAMVRAHRTACLNSCTHARWGERGGSPTLPSFPPVWLSNTCPAPTPLRASCVTVLRMACMHAM